MITDDTFTKLTDLLPDKKLSLPLKGYANGDTRHVLMMNIGLKEVWKRMSKFNIFSIMASVYTRSYLSYLSLASTVSRIPQFLFGMNFVGVQQMRYKGFTTYLDRNLSSFSSRLHYALNPSEFVLYGEPVYSMTDGEVVEVLDKFPDQISRKSLQNIGMNTSADELYGNRIIIQHGLLEYIYSGLQRNSVQRFHVGDKVTAGQEIGRVGCQGVVGTSPYLVVHSRVAHLHARIAWLQVVLQDKFGHNYQEAQITLPLLNFEPFYEMPLITPVCNTPEAIDRFLNQDIKYQFNRGVMMHSGSFIRKI